MGTIVLQFVEGTGLGSGMIKWFGHGSYSHVDAVLLDGSLLGARSDVIDGIPAGVQIRPASYVAHEKVSRIVLPADDDVAKAFYDAMHAEIGRPYNKMGIVAFFFNANWTSVGHWFCSQLVTAKLLVSGWLKGLSEDPNKVDPDDLYLVISAVLAHLGK